MSWQTNVTTARARLAALEAAELLVVTGAQVAEVNYDGGTVKYAKGATLTEIRAALAEVRAVINRLSGRRSGGVIAPVFGG